MILSANGLLEPFYKPHDRRLPESDAPLIRLLASGTGDFMRICYGGHMCVSPSSAAAPAVVMSTALPLTLLRKVDSRHPK